LDFRFDFHLVLGCVFTLFLDAFLARLALLALTVWLTSMDLLVLAFGFTLPLA
jgi:hypothetical protein